MSAWCGTLGQWEPACLRRALRPDLAHEYTRTWVLNAAVDDLQRVAPRQKAGTGGRFTGAGRGQALMYEQPAPGWTYHQREVASLAMDSRTYSDPITRLTISVPGMNTISAPVEVTWRTRP